MTQIVIPPYYRLVYATMDRLGPRVPLDIARACGRTKADVRRAMKWGLKHGLVAPVPGKGHRMVPGWRRELHSIRQRGVA